MAQSSRDATAVVPRRVVAGIIDTVLTLSIAKISGILAGGNGGIVFFVLLLYVVGHYGFAQGMRGLTVGKAGMKLRLVNGAGQNPGVVPSLMRTALFLVDGILFIGVLLMVGTPGHRRFGDTAAGTFVVDAGAAGEPLPVKKFRMTTEAPKAAKVEDTAIAAKREAQAKKRLRRKKKEADPYVIPWTPGNAPAAATRAKEADVAAAALAAGIGGRRSRRQAKADATAVARSVISASGFTARPAEVKATGTGAPAEQASTAAEDPATTAGKRPSRQARRAHKRQRNVPAPPTPAMAANGRLPEPKPAWAPPGLVSEEAGQAQKQDSDNSDSDDKSPGQTGRGRSLKRILRTKDNTGPQETLISSLAEPEQSPSAVALAVADRPSTSTPRVVEVEDEFGLDAALWRELSPENACEPQWDPARGVYVQFDLNSWQWMAYDHVQGDWELLR